MDRFAAIADVHGNRWALEAVLGDIERRQIRQIVNLGDHLFGPLDAPGTADLLMSLHLPGVAGNQDREEMPLSPVHRKWLNNLPFSLEIPGMLLFHGTPQADDVYLLETVHSEGVALANSADIALRLGNRELPPLLLCGHTHIPRVVCLCGILVVNPGSVGLQAYADSLPFPHVMETGSPHARYAILTRDETGWRVEQIQIPYDWESAARCASANRRDDWAYRLRTGRAFATSPKSSRPRS